MATSSSDHPVLRNVLMDSKSPYLLQHKDNPVAWQEFKPATLELAKQLDRPIFLSSGYSACHWCHVLAHESFEDPSIAALLNDHFLPIKVDREERPDVDRVYMTYLQATQGGGGWPLSVFLLPTLEPFFAGTYFPNPRFKALLLRIMDLWEDDRAQCEEMGRGVVQMLQEIGKGRSGKTPASLAHLISTNPALKTLDHLRQTYDPRYGGFAQGGERNRGPKFPSPSLTLEPLARIALYGVGDPAVDTGSEAGEGEDVREEARKMGAHMLRGIWEGGIRDWVGGGVARYSVDERWIVPHFEKMLYDQAQLLSSSIDFALLSDPATPGLTDSEIDERRADRKVCVDLAADILKYVLRDLQSPGGGFWGAEDADSAPSPGAKKREGAYYVWSKDEMDEVLGENAEVIEYFFGVEADGNVDPQRDMHNEMTGMNILYQAHSPAEVARHFELNDNELKDKLDRALEHLYQRRQQRERPGLDDKNLTAWNGLMLLGLAKAITHLPLSYGLADTLVSASIGCVQFVRSELYDPATHTLFRSYREGRGPPAQMDDYAFLIRGLLDIHQALSCAASIPTDFSLDSILSFALSLQSTQLSLFWDPDAGGFFASLAGPDTGILVRMKDAQDGAEPSGTSVSAHNLSRLSVLASDEFERWEGLAEGTFRSVGAELEQVPWAFGGCVAGLMDLQAGYRELVVTGAQSDPLVAELLSLINSVYMPNKVLIRIDPERPPTELARINGTVRGLLGETGAALRVCENGVCGLPITSVSEARRILFQRS